MKNTIKLLAILCFSVGGYAPSAFAGDAVSTMAKIVGSLQHFPSDADKAALAEITAGDSSASIKAVASAIAGISHKVGSADNKALEAIAANEAEPANLRELATIVVGVNHIPNAEAKVALAALAGK